MLFLDSLHGRRICRAFWDYYKVMNVIDDSCYQINALLPASETEGPGEAEFSMLRLKDIARQRELFSDMESETSSDEETTLTGSMNSSRRSRARRSTSLDRDLEPFRRLGQRSNSTQSYFKVSFEF